MTKNTIQIIVASVAGLGVGYLLCHLINKNKISVNLGADGKPTAHTSQRRKNYKWSGAGKAMTHSKRGNSDWGDAYVNSGAIFSLTGNTDTYMGDSYSETTLTLNVNGNPTNIWLLTSSLIQI